ncbi:MAG: tRNA (adenosine(37)-N6)-threonylcarbamoyltransferase complex ATPase subunit type 1 TsaE [Bacteroidota bacterium]
MNFKASSIDDLSAISKQIIENFSSEKVFAFYGSMGAGKTTLIKEICKTLGVSDNVTSPTFAIVNQYTDNTNKPIFHFDFYRIKKLSEAYDLGYEDYFYGGNYCLIEWPELIEELLPLSFVKVSIIEENNERTIIVEQVNNKYHDFSRSNIC